MKANGLPQEVLRPRPTPGREELTAIVYDEVVQHLLRGTRDDLGAQNAARVIARRVGDRACKATKV